MALLQMAIWRCDFCGKEFEGFQRQVDYQDWCGKCDIEPDPSLDFLLRRSIQIAQDKREPKK